MCQAGSVLPDAVPCKVCGGEAKPAEKPKGIEEKGGAEWTHVSRVKNSCRLCCLCQVNADSRKPNRSLLLPGARLPGFGNLTIGGFCRTGGVIMRTGIRRPVMTRL